MQIHLKCKTSPSYFTTSISKSAQCLQAQFHFHLGTSSCCRSRRLFLFSAGSRKSVWLDSQSAVEVQQTFAQVPNRQRKNYKRHETIACEQRIRGDLPATSMLYGFLQIYAVLSCQQLKFRRKLYVLQEGILMILIQACREAHHEGGMQTSYNTCTPCRPDLLSNHTAELIYVGSIQYEHSMLQKHANSFCCYWAKVSEKTSDSHYR